MRKLAALITCALGLLLLASCGIDAGRVERKEFIPPYDYTCQISSVTVQSGNTPITLPIYGTCHEPERHVLYLRNGEDTGSVYVTEHEYNNIRHGDWYGER